jgi:DNA polymerase-3 subunit delta
MGISTPKRLIDDVAGGKVKPAYYFYGAEDYRISEATRFVAHQFLPDKQLTTNFRRLDGRRTKCIDLVAELSVFPMLGERQVFSVSDIQSFKPTEVDRLLKLIDQSDTSRVIIFSSPSTKTPKKKSAFFKKLSAVVDCVEFARLTQRQAGAQIKTALSRAELDIEPDALQMLVGLLDGNRGALVSEVGKLTDFKQSGEMIDTSDIEKIAAGYQTYTVFELADYIIAGDRSQVLGLVRRLITGGQSPTGLLYFLGGHFITLYLVKAGKPLEPYRRWLEGKFRGQAAGYELDHLRRIIGLIAEVDANLRKKRTIPELALDQLILQMMSP